MEIVYFVSKRLWWNRNIVCLRECVRDLLVLLCLCKRGLVWSHRMGGCVLHLVHLVHLVHLAHLAHWVHLVHLTHLAHLAYLAYGVDLIVHLVKLAHLELV